MWRRATPLTEKLAATPRWAIRTWRTGPSSMILIRRWRSTSPGQRAATSARKRALIS